MKILILSLSLISITFLSTGCKMNDGYQFGDITKSVSKTVIEQYCQETNEALREKIKENMKRDGVGLPVDACKTIAITKAMVKQ